MKFCSPENKGAGKIWQKSASTNSVWSLCVDTRPCCCRSKPIVEPCIHKQRRRRTSSSPCTRSWPRFPLYWPRSISSTIIILLYVVITLGCYCKPDMIWFFLFLCGHVLGWIQRLLQHHQLHQHHGHLYRHHQHLVSQLFTCKKVYMRECDCDSSTKKE